MTKADAKKITNPVLENKGQESIQNPNNTQEKELEKLDIPKAESIAKNNIKQTNPQAFPPFDDFVDGLGSWKESLKKITQSKSFQNLYEFLKQEYQTKKIYPPAHLIFNAFKLTPLSNVKVVIVGQDPYHQPGQAMGLCFSVPKGVRVPSSLINIYKSLESDPNIKGFKKPNHGDLTNWAMQGVFLLNTILTVEDSRPESHRNSGWDPFTDYVINVVNQECNQVVFLLWGLPAQKKGKGVNQSKHFVLKTSHPSGLSYNKGFSTAYHFSKVNEILRRVGKTEIIWNLD